MNETCEMLKVKKQFNAIDFLICDIVGFAYSGVRRFSAECYYILCKTFQKSHIKYAATAADIYILLPGKMLLSNNLMWNEISGAGCTCT